MKATLEDQEDKGRGAAAWVLHVGDRWRHTGQSARREPVGGV